MKCKTKSNKAILTERVRDIKIPADYPWKLLGWLSDDLGQFLTEDELWLITYLIRNRDMQSLLVLADVWGLQLYRPTDGPFTNFCARYQLANFLKKFQFRTNTDACRLTAISNFMDGEEKCRRFNETEFLRLAGAEEEWLVDVFTYARSFLLKVLGYEPPSPGMMDRSRHGPGATLDTENGYISSYHKYEKWPYQCTSAALGLAREAIEADERWLGALEDAYRTANEIPMWQILNRQQFWVDVFEVVDGNRIEFVPKNAKTDRSIAIEPTMNLYLQLGVDGFIRRRLKRWGVDLDNQTKNQELARLGSLGKGYATLDLKNASNTISRKLVELLVPKDWYDLLCKLRSPSGVLQGESLKYEMISSMGNGYTFALESAIFAAFIFAVRKQQGLKSDSTKWAVFGDDLIIEESLVEKLKIVLACAGFTINEEKSFFSGPVRESCGTDWIQGRLVRPVFLENYPTSVTDLYSIYNRIKRMLSLRFGIEESKTLSRLVLWIPEFFRNFKGPLSDEEFDAYLHCERPQSRYKECMWTYTRCVWTSIPQKGKNFFFRKLMHTLHPLGPAIEQKWQKRQSGSQFKVHRRNAETLSLKSSRTSIWCDEYRDYTPRKL